MNSLDAISLLRTQSLTSVVYEELERLIAAGDLVPGEPLRESTVATQMGISRGPVREAFRMLEERGLLEFEKNCGARLRQLNLEQATHIYQVRIPLEGLIGELSAEHLNDEGKQALEQVLADMQTAVQQKNVSRYTALNFQFHDLLAQYSNNPVLYDSYRRLVVQLKLCRSYTFRHNPDSISISLREHQAIYAAIAAANAKLASDLLQQHATASLERFKNVAQSA
ncbi:FCD domain-containing protein [Brackiella oedipodis]|uniref:FCD domain-containing protein n=1 Tax=Brackiella oedipodis TaxID=124225 RepID=UPI00048A74CD|nr:FCD domain-containing protein [Brackiella oedipodis]